MTSAFSWQNSVSLHPASIWYSKAKFVCYSSYVLTSYYCIPVPYDEKDIFFWVLVLEGLVDLHRAIHLQLLWHYWLAHTPTSWGIDLDYCDVEWLALEMNGDHSVIFWDCAQILHFELLLTMRAALFLLRNSFPQLEIEFWIELSLSLILACAVLC